MKAFINAYQMALKAGFPRAENKRWRAILPWVIVRLAHYRGLDGKYRLFRYSHWIPAQWREFHELYEYARLRGWQREQLVFGVGAFAKPGVSFEQEYLKTLLLMRLDSGNFTPDQVEWVAAPARRLGAHACAHCATVGRRAIHPRSRRLRRPAPARARAHGRAPAVPRRLAGVLAHRGAPALAARARHRDARSPTSSPCASSVCCSCGSPRSSDPMRSRRRRARSACRASTDVRVVVGLQALTRAVAEIDRIPEQARTPGVVASFDEVTQMVNPHANPETVTRRIRGSTWRLIDRSDTGCRLMAPTAEAPSRLGELIAIKEGELWMLAVVRRMQRLQVDEVTVGAEVIARRLVRVLMRAWVTPADDGRGSNERPFFGLYLPAHPDNRQASQRSLIGPEDKFSHGAMVELDTGNARYLIRFTQTLERQAGWSWAMFNAVRKLSS